MSAPGGTDRGEFSRIMLNAVLEERWRAVGSVIYRTQPKPTGKVPIVDLTATLSGYELESARARVMAAAPQAVRLVLEALPLLVDLQRAAEGSSADAEVLGLHVNLSRARLAELVKLNAQVTAALEGRS